MKLMHISDLHIGKRVHEYSMIDDQRYILHQIVNIAVSQKVSGILLAGDIYDKSIPTVEAVELFDEFITSLAEQKIVVMAIAGNHDSPERIDFGRRIMGQQDVHLAGEYQGRLQEVILQDEYGAVSVYLMPYIRPGVVNRYLGTSCMTFDEGVAAAIAAAKVDRNGRNILVAHQFVTALGQETQRSDSETKSLGGTDNVDFSHFDDFDYVALGHIHRPQRIGRDAVRYSGTPLKYSFSEANHQKSVVIVELKEKGEVSLSYEKLEPKRDMKEIRGTLAKLKSGACYQDVPKESYVHITLTDEELIIDAIGKVREVYPNVMQLDFARNERVEEKTANRLSGQDLQEQTPLELFADFFAMQNQVKMSDGQRRIFQDIMESKGEM